MKNDLLITKLETAKRDITQAEKDLEKVLSEIRVAPRAEKTAISEALEDAFTKLQAARTELVDMEAMLLKDDV